jgi:hypothetical protein
MTDKDDAADPTDRMVLRTVYLPPDLDDALRVWAFRSNVSKGDIIREAVARQLKAVAGYGDKPSVEDAAADKPSRATKAKRRRSGGDAKTTPQRRVAGSGLR